MSHPTRPVGRLRRVVALLLAGAALVLAACVSGEPAGGWVWPVIDRESAIPAEARKLGPPDDATPPQLHSTAFEAPEPLPYPINTAGGEDSPFVAPDGQTLYFFFTPDVGVPAEEQLHDGVTGIYVSQRTDGGWSQPQRVQLQAPDKLALDGCPTLAGDTLWFCSAREGYTGVHHFTAERDAQGRWRKWTDAGDTLNQEYQAGELHISSDGSELYFHAHRVGGKGGYDIWVSRAENGDWGYPQNVAVVNSDEDEGWPCLSAAGDELWFTRTVQGAPAIYRSQRVAGQWQPPEMVISQLAGEPSLDEQGNLYFVHHYFSDGQMVEADIYLARRKQ